MSKHTPGPWFPRWNGHYHDIQIGKHDYSQTVANVTRNLHIDAMTPETTSANAWLVSAAPDLLAALKVALEVMENVDGENDCRRGIRAAEAAIAKAEGGEA